MNLREQLGTWSWKQVLICLVCIWSALWLLQPPVLNAITWYFARDMASENPSVFLAPEPLHIQTSADLRGNPEAAAFGWAMQLPAPKVEKHEELQSAAIFAFGDGGSMLFLDPAKEVNTAAYYREQKGAIVEILQPEELRSQYNFEAAKLQAQPSEVSLWHSRKRNARAALLLGLKSIDTQETNIIQNISSQNLRGFQFGDPSVPHGLVKLLLYDANDRSLDIILRTGKLRGWTQEQVNAFVNSLKPTN